MVQYFIFTVYTSSLVLEIYFSAFSAMKVFVSLWEIFSKGVEISQMSLLGHGWTLTVKGQESEWVIIKLIYSKLAFCTCMLDVSVFYFPSFHFFFKSLIQGEPAYKRIAF